MYNNEGNVNRNLRKGYEGVSINHLSSERRKINKYCNPSLCYIRK